MGVWALFFIQSVLSLRILFEGVGNGPSFAMSKKFSMFRVGDLYGQQRPYLNVTVEYVDGRNSFFAVMKDEEYQILMNEDPIDLCKSNNYSMKGVQSEEFIYRKVEKSGLYAVVLLVCEPQFRFRFLVESKNPFGHLTGDHILLVPFYAILSVLYLIFLFFWCINLCAYYKHAISVQKYCIPLILTVCILEHSLNFWYWEYINLLGSKSWILLFLSIIFKGLRDSFGRSLLMSASYGWGIINDNPPFGNFIIYICGFVYFIFDLVYETFSKLYIENQLWVIIATTFPLILINAMIFYFVFAWFAQSFMRLKLMKQTYKLSLIKKFAFVLIIGAIISIIWTIVELFTKFFLTIEEYWIALWLYIGIWDVIFMVMAISFMVIWRIDEKSQLLAHSYQVQADDLSYEQEEQYGIELPRIAK